MIPLSKAYHWNLEVTLILYSYDITCEGFAFFLQIFSFKPPIRTDKARI